VNEHQNCHVEPIIKPLDTNALESALVSLMAVSGMGCPRCATRVSNSLLSVDGVLSADVKLEQGVVAAAYDPEQVDTSDLINAVSLAGNDGHHNYQANVLQTTAAPQALS